MTFRIGHIFLNGSENGCSEHFVRLVDGLEQQGLQQHVIVGNHDLAARAAVGSGVTVGPTTRSAVMATVLMPHVSLVHAHDEEAGKAALLMQLTRSIPYVTTCRADRPIRRSPILYSIYERAELIIATTSKAAESLSATRITTPVIVIGELESPAVSQKLAEHTQAYHQAADRLSVPTMLL